MPTTTTPAPTTKRSGKKPAAKPAAKAIVPPTPPTPDAPEAKAAEEQRLAALRDPMRGQGVSGSEAAAAAKAATAAAKAATSKASDSSASRSAGAMSFAAAAEKVLREGKEPMHVKDITETVLKRKLSTTSGKTPVATMAAVLMRATRDKGKFVKVAPGTFDVRELNPRAAKKRPA